MSELKECGVNISRALTVDGWMSERELTWLASQAREISSRGSSVFVEIGTWKGRSARAIGDNLRGSSYLWCVDAYDTRSDLIESAASGEIVLSEAQINLRDLVACGRILITQIDSQSAAGTLASSGVRPVRNDIRVWLPLLHSEGILCGHDYGVYPGVGEAVRLAFGTEFGIVKGTSIWVKSKRS